MLTQDEWEKALLYLGVPNDYHIYLTIPALSGVYEAELRTHLATVERVEAALVAIEPDTLASKVGDLEVNPARQIINYRQQGSRALKGISNILQIPIMFDRFNLSSKPARLGFPIPDPTKFSRI